MDNKYMHALARATTDYGQHSRDRWARLAATGATDDEIVAELNYNFGLGGGTSASFVTPEWHQGNPPRVWFYIVPDGRPHLYGKKLVRLVRQLYSIGYPPNKRINPTTNRDAHSTEPRQLNLF